VLSEGPRTSEFLRNKLEDPGLGKLKLKDGEFGFLSKGENELISSTRRFLDGYCWEYELDMKIVSWSRSLPVFSDKGVHDGRRALR
jgi:hypothetical protein